MSELQQKRQSARKRWIATQRKTWIELGLSILVGGSVAVMLLTLLFWYLYSIDKL